MGTRTNVRLRGQETSRKKLFPVKLFHLERRARGHGIDWSPAEIAILRRQDLAPKAMAALLPGRT
jgi:hypothetical protein